MDIVLLFIALTCMLTGGALSLYAWKRYRSDEAPQRVPSWNPKDWRPLWKMRDCFTNARGFRMYWIGIEAFGLGALISTFVLAFLR
jgi:hypothetical protein